jgi:hypothetical protein
MIAYPYVTVVCFAGYWQNHEQKRSLVTIYSADPWEASSGKVE